MHIAVVGNIGVGKTTLSRMLSKQFNWELLEERVDDNPYLEKFYQDMERWSFNLQIFFLNSRFNQLRYINESSASTIVQDRTIYEDANIFAKNLNNQAILSKDDYNTYLDLYSSIASVSNPPDLLIFLDASVSKLVENISKRRRPYETTMSIDYLESLQVLYRNWIADYDLGKKLVIQSDELDFVNNPDDFASIVEKISRELFGLFS